MTPSVHCPPPHVHWTVVARRHLRQALARPVGCHGANALDTTMNDLDNRLRRLFPNACSIVVQDLYVGYRRRDDRFILLVEIDDPERPGRHVVKLGPEECLAAELAAWEKCRPHGLRHDLVFMTLDGPERDGQLVGLVYGDAQQFLGSREVVYLEQAFLQAVLYGSPSPVSVAETLVQLYERMGHLLYSSSDVVGPDESDFVLNVPRLEASLAAWSGTDDMQARVRRDVNVWASADRDRFRDPVDFLDCVRACVPTCKDGQLERREGDPAAKDLVPRMLRGCCHGDLHGRNVFVALVHGRALWPAVFDYEHMSDWGLIAWDFVKMETELKIRVYPQLYASQPTQKYVPLIRDFEERLARQTEACYNGTERWPEVSDEASREERLASLLLALRRQAALHLGGDRKRPREWLAEYYFALACYGIQSGRFQNLGRLELIGAYVSAGVATARHLWSNDQRL